MSVSEYSHAESDFEDFARGVRPSLLARARWLCGNHDEAEDLTQETLIVLCRRWPEFDRRGRPNAYVSIVLNSRFVDARRHSRWHRERLDGSVPERHDVDAFATLERRIGLDRALSTLGVRQRDVLVLRYLCDFDARTVSRVLSVSQSTVRSQEARALRSLRERGGLA